MIKMKGFFICLFAFVLLFSTGCSNNPSIEASDGDSDITIDDEIEEIISLYYAMVNSKLYNISYEYLSPESQDEYPLDTYKEYIEYQEEYCKLTYYDVTEIHYLNDDTIIVEMDVKRTNPFDSTDSDGYGVMYFKIIDDELKIVLDDSFRFYTALALDYISYYNNKNGDYELAIYDATLSKEIMPLNHSPYHELVIAYSLSGNMDAALNVIDEYILIYPKIGENDYYLSEMYHYRGFNLLGKGQRNEAIAAYERALEIDPSRELTKLTLNDLKNQ